MRSLAPWLVALALCVLACSDDDKGPPSSTSTDAGPLDAGSGTTPFDANVPLPREPHDAGPPPVTMPDPGLVGHCAIDSDTIFVAAEGGAPFPGTPLAVDPVRSIFAVPYVVPTSGCVDTLHVATLKGAATEPAPESKQAIDECTILHDPSITAVQSGWLLGVVDNRMPPWDVWVLPYDATAGTVGTAQRVSETANDEKSLQLGTLRDGTVIAAWTEEASDGSTSTLHARALGQDGAPAGDVVDVDSGAGLYFGALVVASLGPNTAALGYWRHDLDLSRSELVLQVLDNQAKPAADPWVVTDHAGPAASIDIVEDDEAVFGTDAGPGDERGAIVYTQAEAGSGRHVWFQEIDGLGRPAPLPRAGGTAPPARVVNSPFRGVDVSITKLRSSYAVVYRALPRTMTDQPEIRIYFLDRFGAIIGDSDLGFTSLSGGRTAIDIAYDGRIVLGWNEISQSGKSSLKVVRLPCVGG